MSYLEYSDLLVNVKRILKIEPYNNYTELLDYLVKKCSFLKKELDNAVISSRVYDLSFIRGELTSAIDTLSFAVDHYVFEINL